MTADGRNKSGPSASEEQNEAAPPDSSTPRVTFRMQAPITIPGLDVVLRGYLSGITGPQAFEDAYDPALDDDTFLVNTLRRLVRTPESSDADPAAWSTEQRQEALNRFLERNPRLRPAADQEEIAGFRKAVRREAEEYRASFDALRDAARAQLSDPIREAIENVSKLTATMQAARVGTRQYEDFVRAVQAATDPLSGIRQTIAEVQAHDTKVIADALAQLRDGGALAGVTNLLSQTGRGVPTVPKSASTATEEAAEPPAAVVETLSAESSEELSPALAAQEPAVGVLLDLLVTKIEDLVDQRVDARLAHEPRWRKPEVYLAALGIVVVVAIAGITWWREDRPADHPAASVAPTASFLPSASATFSPSPRPSASPTPARTASPLTSASAAPSARPSGP